MQYTSEQFKTIAQNCDACLVAEVYVDDNTIGNEMKVKGSAPDIVKMLGSLVSYVGQQIVDLENPENFKAYLDAISTNALESLIHRLEGKVNEEYSQKTVIK